MKGRFAHCRSGFSLVEIMVAVGIFVFAIISVLGLLAVSNQANRAASEETVVAVIFQKVQEYLACRELQDLLTNAAYRDEDADFYFDIYGNELDAGARSQAVFQCTVTCDTAAGGSANYGQAILRVEYPFAAPPASRRSVIMPVGLANYR